MKKKIIIITVTLMLFTLNLIAKNSDLITAQLKEKLQNAADMEFIDINIVLEKQYDSGKLIEATKSLSRTDKINYVKKTLKSFAAEEQKDILQELQSSQTDVKDINALWIANVISCSATPEAINILTGRNDIESIDYDEKRNLIGNTNRSNNEGQNKDNETREITWNVEKVNAPEVWDLGFTGEDVLVAVIDSGVNYNHQDLSDHMWENTEYPYHGYDFVNGDNNPMDDNGHGSHCAGTVAGDGSAGSQTGVAPDATIMALKVLDSWGDGQESGCWSALEFCIEHEVNVISMSLGWLHAWGPNRQVWRNNMNNVLAAGIVASIAAGNEGDDLYSYPVPDNIRTPGDCPPPWLHPDQTLSGGISAVITVGATNNYDGIGGFSSHGPVTWESVSGYNDYAYQPEIGLIRPDVVAPGVSIKSIDYSSNYGYLDGWDGTSMATPCNAGVIALMLSKNPLLSPAEINQILEENAEPLSTEKSNIYGSGRIDALASIEATSYPNSPPGQVISPIPENDAFNVMTSIVFHWEAGYGGEPESYNFYLGTDNPPSNIVNGESITENFYEMDAALEFETVYYWRVDAGNEFGETEGQIWTFETNSLPDEDFETNDFSLFDWTFEGNENWLIDSTTSLSGDYSARSGDIYDIQYSSMIIELDIVEAGHLVFWKKVSTEENIDKLKFYIDDEIQDSWSGEIPWSEEIYEIGYGHHKFEWKYVKYNGNDEGEDCVWIDYIAFPDIGEIAPANLVVDPEVLETELVPNSAISVPLSLTNSGGDVINYSLSLDYIDDSGWLAFSSNSGSLAENETDEIDIYFYSTDMYEGEYEANITISDNREETIVPVILNVSTVNSQENSIVKNNQLLGNIPNPFNPQTEIKFQISKLSNVELVLYNLKGQQVRKFSKSNLSAGMHSFIWNGKDRYNSDVSSGIYLYSLIINGKLIDTQRCLLLK